MSRFLACVFLVASGTLSAQESTPSPTHKYFGEIVLVNQDGDEMRLYSDVLANRTVVINTIFTECNASCPVMSGTFAKLQDHLGDHLGKDVYLVSISVDPGKDTSKVLKDYATRFKARPGWYFLTGKKENVEAALRKLGAFVEDRNEHQNLFLVGNDKTGLWKKIFGLAKVEDIFASVDSVVHDVVNDK